MRGHVVAVAMSDRTPHIVYSLAESLTLWTLLQTESEVSAFGWRGSGCPDRAEESHQRNHRADSIPQAVKHGLRVVVAFPESERGERQDEDEDGSDVVELPEMRESEQRGVQDRRNPA